MCSLVCLCVGECCLLFVVGCLCGLFLFVVWWLSVVYRLSFGVCCVLFGIRFFHVFLFLSVVRGCFLLGLGWLLVFGCWLMVVGHWLFVVDRCLLVVIVCCLLFDV